MPSGLHLWISGPARGGFDGLACGQTHVRLADTGLATRAEAESAVLEKIAEMAEPERDMAGRLHDIIKANAPDLAPKLWYGMPAYARDGKILCFFQSAEKFGTRYATLGFNDTANLDDGDLFPVAYALKTLTAAGEAKIARLVKQAVS